MGAGFQRCCLYFAAVYLLLSLGGWSSLKAESILINEVEEELVEPIPISKGWGFTCGSYCCGRGQTRITLGYRQDNFKWSIAGFGGTPNILSELDWDKLHMLEATLWGWHSSWWLPYLRWSGSYSAIMRGSVTDDDYACDNRHLLFSRSKANGSRGNVIELSGGLGWPFFWQGECGAFQLAPVAGISWHQQHLHLQCGRQLFSLLCHVPKGNIKGLDSEYFTHWWGGWAGVDLFCELGPRHTLTGSFEYHYGVRYRARGDWNLRTDFAGGFTHRARGHAWLARFGWQFAYTCHWLWSLDLAVQRWQTRRGIDLTKLNVLVTDENDCPLGFEKVTVSSPFNGAQWDSFSIALGVAYRY